MGPLPPSTLPLRQGGLFSSIEISSCSHLPFNLRSQRSFDWFFTSPPSRESSPAAAAAAQIDCLKVTCKMLLSAGQKTEATLQMCGVIATGEELQQLLVASCQLQLQLQLLAEL